MRKGRLYLVLLIGASLAGCVAEGSGTNAVCRWTGDTAGPLDLRDDRAARHLSEDAERAEDVAIRYGDGHSRPGTAPGATMADYFRVREQCMATLFQLIADRHHVTSQQVRDSINTHRHASLDWAVMVSFALFYAFWADRFVRGLWRRFPPVTDRLHGIIATLAVSPVAGLLGLEIGEGWARYAETLRIGYGHLVQRDQRIPWGHHRLAIFLVGVFLFCILSQLRYREARLRRSPIPTSLLGLLSADSEPF
jgi:hypothetical protein